LRSKLWRLAKRLTGGAVGPLLSFIALFGLPILGAVTLDDRNFAFWALLSSIATVALSLDFGGVALLTARFYSEARGRLLVKSCALSASGALAIGIVACIVWIPYSGTQVGKSIPTSAAIAAIAAMSIASAVRSVLMVVAQAALVASQLLLRNVAIAGHALCAALTTSLLLFKTHSFWALPIGWLTSGIAVSCLALPWAWRTCTKEISEAVIVQPFRWRQYAGLRTLSTIVSSVLLNSDRWIIGALSGPVVLAAYEVAWRFAVLPRFLVQNLMVRVGADVAALGNSDEEQLRVLLKGSTIIAIVVGALSCAPVAIAYWLFLSFTDAAPHWILFFAILAAFTLFSLTAPLSTAGAAVGNAWIDIPYGLGALAVSGVGAMTAGYLGRLEVFVAAYLMAIAVSIVWYWQFAPALIRQGLQTRTTLTAPV